MCCADSPLDTESPLKYNGARMHVRVVTGTLVDRVNMPQYPVVMFVLYDDDDDGDWALLFTQVVVVVVGEGESRWVEVDNEYDERAGDDAARPTSSLVV